MELPSFSLDNRLEYQWINKILYSATCREHCSFYVSGTGISERNSIFTLNSSVFLVFSITQSFQVKYNYISIKMCISTLKHGICNCIEGDWLPVCCILSLKHLSCLELWILRSEFWRC
jgi:hypothetical protein